jgi:hypothetical protein
MLAGEDEESFSEEYLTQNNAVQLIIVQFD